MKNNNPTEQGHT